MKYRLSRSEKGKKIQKDVEECNRTRSTTLNIGRFIPFQNIKNSIKESLGWTETNLDVPDVVLLSHLLKENTHVKVLWIDCL